ncbi:tubby C-terminal-like domain-containing protein [Artemisia annua]|uniref:Tubby C-terminal-like domain-containing protein n=1 Tax=Artemisia annua TaxID=35608 RepID=A0A2U1L6X4_ARTAN|nr:tubby C-terminal-like domain-containing protein [Artemisia annua]
MAKIHPCITSSSASSSSFCSDQKQTYTIWMKSLVLNSNGYTVYDSNGGVVYRIDNYDSKSSSEVYLMDLRGNVVCTILRKKLLKFGLWDCYNDKDTRKPWFKVGKPFNLFKHDSVYDVVFGTNETQSISSSNHKMEFKIIDSKGKVAAEVQRKRSSSGVVLGDDVLCVTVEPHVDHIFVMALVAIHGLIHHKM